MLPPEWVEKWAARLAEEWHFRGRLQQQGLWRYEDGQPDGWLVIGGRGAGKTRLGAEWVNALVHGFSPFAEGRAGRIALVGETLSDVREVMVEGPSGIVSVARMGRPRYEASRRRLLFNNGAVAQAFSSEDPESLRGPQFEAAWCDELAKWKNVEATFDMLQFGLRLGTSPAQLITTTPRPIPLLMRLIEDGAYFRTDMRTADNAANLAPGFLPALMKRYGDSRLGRQEIEGEIVADRPDALWSRETIEKALAGPAAGTLLRIVVAVDPPATSRRTSSACGIVVAGNAGEGRAVVLEDGTVEAASPKAWAMKAVALYHRFGADAIVAEVNQGGEMVVSVLKAVDAGVPVRQVRASRGKWMRAEPVAALYEQGKVSHARRFPALEDEMCDFGPDGLSGGRSPDRLDALVWALSELMLKGRGEPKVRAF